MPACKDFFSGSEIIIIAEPLGVLAFVSDEEKRHIGGVSIVATPGALK